MKSIFIVYIVVLFLPEFSIYSQDFKNISLREVLSVGNEDSDEFYQWVGVTTDKEGFIYVSDAMDYSIKKFDPYGNLILKTGRKGKGPGEFLAPRLINYFSGKLYINDQNKPGIQIFNSETLNYISNIPYELPISNFKILSKNKLSISSIDYSTDEWSRIFVIDSLGNVLDNINIARKNVSIISNTVALNFDKENNIYIVF